MLSLQGRLKCTKDTRHIHDHLDFLLWLTPSVLIVSPPRTLGSLGHWVPHLCTLPHRHQSYMAGSCFLINKQHVFGLRPGLYSQADPYHPGSQPLSKHTCLHEAQGWIGLVWLRPVIGQGDLPQGQLHKHQIHAEKISQPFIRKTIHCHVNTQDWLARHLVRDH